MATSFDQLFERAVAATEQRLAREARRISRGARRRLDYLKVPCPADRMRETWQGIECAARRKPKLVKLGHLVVRLDASGTKVAHPKRLAGLPARELAAIDREIRRSRRPASEVIEEHARELAEGRGRTKPTEEAPF